METPENTKDLESRPLFSLFGDTLKIDVFKVKRFTNLDGETIDFASAYRRRVVPRVEGRPVGPPLPRSAILRTLKRMRDDASDREDIRFLELLEKQRARQETPCSDPAISI